MRDFDVIATSYLNAFNATDPQRRTELVASLFTDDVTYVDPMAEVSGHEGVSAFIAGAQAQFPGWRFTLAGDVDGHHNQARFKWGLGPEGEESPVIGFDVINLDESGKIAAVHGFLDQVPTI
ncbi:nuclear transport factor 2 family protein [Glycomyces tarimensis]